MGLLGLPVPGPGDAVRAATGVYTALDQAVALVPRLAALLGRLDTIADRVEELLERVDGVVTQADAVVGRARRSVDDVDQVVTGARTIVTRTDGVVESAGSAVTRADEAVARANEVITNLSGIGNRIATTTEADEVEALVRLIDNLPVLVETLLADVVPIMATLGTVAPDLRDLLDIAAQLNGMLGSVPGLGRIKKRVEKAQAEDDDAHTADHDPPSSPDTEAARAPDEAPQRNP